MLRSSHYKHIDDRLQNWFRRSRFFGHLTVSRELYLILFFLFLFLIIFLRLFFLQVINQGYYDQQLNQQHVSETALKAKRGNIFADDKAQRHIQLTDTISLYNVYVDPKFVWDKQKFIDIITPVLYQHFCQLYGMQQVGPIDCIKHLEIFTQKKLLPPTPQFFYFGSGRISSGYEYFDWTGYNAQIQMVLSGFTKDIAYGIIKDELQKDIYIGIKPKNYLGFFENTQFISDLQKLQLPFVDIQADNYVYIVPAQVGNLSKGVGELKTLLNKYSYLSLFPNLENVFQPQENRYVKLLSDANPLIAQTINDLQDKYYTIKSPDKIPLLHGLGLEATTRRYYEYGSFLSNVLGFVDKNGNAFYGVEQYFDSLLRGHDGKIVGRSSAWIGPVGANEFNIQDVQDGNDVYLTVDVGIQKEVETVIKKYYTDLRADSISVLILDPISGQIKASANYPSYNPNDYSALFALQPLGPQYGRLLDDLSYIEIPTFIETGGAYRPATTVERFNPSIPKYVAQNMYGSLALVDKNISMAYEPGSVFKAFTVSVGLDTDEIKFYDPYSDPNKVQVGQFWIKNADFKDCGGDSNFLHAFVYSCNVGMVRVAQRLGKESFYNYLEDFGFGKATNIELANEDPGFVEGVSSVSDARFFNNAFGQGLLVTPLQLAVGYAALVNGGYYLQPTIVKGILDKVTGIYHEQQKKVLRQIVKSETSDAMKFALWSVVDQNPELKDSKIAGYNIGGKTGTSQISYKGKYMQGIGWTNASIVGVLTRDDPRYVIVVQVRRPRSSVWGGYTAGKILGDISKFILSYSLMEK